MAEDKVDKEMNRTIEANPILKIKEEKFSWKGLVKPFTRYKEKLPLISELKSPVARRIPPSYRSLPDMGSMDRSSAAELASQLDNLLGELKGRRDGYRFFPDPAERAELLQIAERTVDYLHDNGIKNFILLDRSARPAHVAVREMWKKKYPNDPLPDVYFVNPTGFVNEQDARGGGKTGMERGVEIMLSSVMGGNDVGDAELDSRSQKEIEQDFEETYQRLTANKDQPTMLFDNCVHSGNSIRPVQQTFQNVGFTNLKIGVVGADGNYSGITPDFVAVNGTPLGVCYPFDQERLVERRFDSVTSRATKDVSKRRQAAALRREIRSIINGTQPEATDEDESFVLGGSSIDRKFSGMSNVPPSVEGLKSSIISGLERKSANRFPQMIMRNDKLPLMQRLAPQFGVSIDTLAREGEEYTTQPTGDHKPFTGTVGEGSSYIRIKPPQNKDLTEFWKAVEAEEANAKELAGSVRF